MDEYNATLPEGEEKLTYDFYRVYADFETEGESVESPLGFGQIGGTLAPSSTVAPQTQPIPSPETIESEPSSTPEPAIDPETVAVTEDPTNNIMPIVIGIVVVIAAIVVVVTVRSRAKNKTKDGESDE